MMRLVDIIYALPFTIFVILLMVFFGRNIILLFVAIGAVEWLTMARIVRGQVMTPKKMEFIEAAQALGYGHARIIFRHLLPNALGPIIVYATLTIPAVMLLEAFLSFLGLGTQPPSPSLGLMLSEGRNVLMLSPWSAVFSGLAILLLAFGLNLLGDVADCVGRVCVTSSNTGGTIAYNFSQAQDSRNLALEREIGRAHV